MIERLHRYARIARVLGIAVIVGLVGVILYQLYDFYSDKLGFTPTKAVDAYFEAMASGDYEQVYRLTDTNSLTDIYGRTVTRGEFIDQLTAVTGERSFELAQISADELFDTRDTHYYVVTLTWSVGGGVSESRLLVEVRRVGGSWVVRYPFAISL